MIEVTEEFKKEIESTFRYKSMFYINNTVFDAVQSPCEFGRISVFEKIFNKKIYVKNYEFELNVN